MDWSSFSIGNAAGFIKGPGQQFDGMLRSAATDIVVGSITYEPREGNIALGTTYHLEDDGTSVNSLGLPNPGLQKTLEAAPAMAAAVEKAGKRLTFSIAGFSCEEYLALLVELQQFGRIEFNFGCPNVWGKAGQKPIPSYNPDMMNEILRHTYSCGGRDFDVKISPSHPDLLREISCVFRQYSIRRVIGCNTFPNGIAFKDGKRVLSTPDGYGGVGGNAMHDIMLGQVSQLASLLEGSGIGVVGVGGINSGERLFATASVGAIGAQIGTAYGEEGVGIFSDIYQRLSRLL